MKNKLLFSTAVILLSATSLSAQDAGFGGSVPMTERSFEGGISTFGPTITAGTKFNDQFGMRIPLGYFEMSRDFEEDGTTLTGTASIGGFGALADYYPIQNNGLRVTAGIIAPLYKVVGQSDGATTEIEGNTYAVDDLRAAVWSTGVSPYIGTGYEFFNNSESGWSGSIDVGALVNVSYKSNYSYSPGSLSASEIASLENDIQTFQNDLMKDLEDNASILPLISLSVKYSF